MKKIFKEEKGISLYFVILIIGILGSATLALSTLLILEIKITRGMGDSVSAFYTADSGIENELFEANPPGTPPYIINLDSERTCEIKILSPGEGECPLEAKYCVESVGIYKNVRRAIRIKR